LPQSLVLLTALERLTLSNNRIRVVPSVYGHITSLTSLELIGNPLDSPPLSL
jgi:Leucine-rich repeat (LRR) protein